MRFPADEDETREDPYAEIWRGLKLDAERRSALERRRSEAERLFAELAVAGADEQGDRLSEERFRSPDLLDLLLEESHAGQLADPARAESLALLAARLAASMAADEPEAPMALARAYSLGANARRLGGDPAGADELLARAALFLEMASERAFYSRIAALVRWEQGRLDEAEALLEYAARLYEEEGLGGEQAICHALLGLLRFESPRLGEARTPLAHGWAGMDRGFHLLVAARTGLALAACEAERGASQRARSLLREVWPLFSEITDERELTALYWLEGLALGRLGDREEALQILESVRRRSIDQSRPAEAALVSVDLAKLLAEAGREEKIPALAAALEELTPESQVFRLAGDHVSQLADIAAAQPACLAEAALAVSSTLRTALRGHRLPLSPLPFV